MTGRERSDPRSGDGSAISGWHAGKDAGGTIARRRLAPAGGRAPGAAPKGQERSGPRERATGVAGVPEVSFREGVKNGPGCPWGGLNDVEAGNPVVKPKQARRSRSGAGRLSGQRG